MSDNKIYQVATLQSLILGYFKKVIDVDELLKHGNIGLGTFENVNGEMIVVDGHCYQAKNDGSVTEVEKTMGVPFAAVEKLNGDRKFAIDKADSIDELKTILNNKIEEKFGLNSMHIARIDGRYESVSARSESEFASQHIELKKVLSNTQKDFYFKNVEGTIVALYYPDYMDGINAPGWHFHFVSNDRKHGGHVFDLRLSNATVVIDKISNIEIKLPCEPSFDTYSLKQASNKDIKLVEQNKKSWNQTISAFFYVCPLTIWYKV